MIKPEVKIETVQGDKVDPSLFVLLVDGNSIFESHDKSKAAKAKRLVNKVFSVADFHLDIDELEDFLEKTIQK